MDDQLQHLSAFKPNVVFSESDGSLTDYASDAWDENGGGGANLFSLVHKAPRAPQKSETPHADTGGAHTPAETASPEATPEPAADEPSPVTPTREPAADLGLLADVQREAPGARGPPEVEAVAAAAEEEVASAALAAAALEALQAAAPMTPAPDDAAAADDADATPAAAALVDSEVIPLCPGGDEATAVEARLRAQLSRTRAQLQAAQLRQQRTEAELAATRHRRDEFAAAHEAAAHRAAELEAVRAAGGGGDPSAARGALVDLAEERIGVLHAELKRREAEADALRNASWGGWAEDEGVKAEMERLREEVTLAGAAQRRLANELAATEGRRAAAAAEGERLAAALAREKKEAAADGARLGAALAAAEKENRRVTAELGASEASGASLAASLEHTTAALAQRDDELRLAVAARETTEEDLLAMRRVAPSGSAAERYDEQLAYLKAQADARAAADAAATQRARDEAAEARRVADAHAAAAAERGVLAERCAALEASHEARARAAAEAERREAEVRAELEATSLRLRDAEAAVVTDLWDAAPPSPLPSPGLAAAAAGAGGRDAAEAGAAAEDG